MRRLALVPTRYGDEVVGGSEAVLREAAHLFAERGWDVEVLTTCAVDHHTWANAMPPGVTTDGPVTVRRFRTVHDGDKFGRDTIERRIQLGLPVTTDEQRTWLNGNFRVPDLFHHLLQHHRDYDAIVLSPYLFWTTVNCALVAPEKTVVMPCLHDEHYAYLEIMRPLLSDVAQVWFLSEPEHDLGHRLGLSTAHHVTGAGVHVPASADADIGRKLVGTDRPFVYYGGRREGGKGWDELLGAFTRAVVEYGAELDLVTTGTGPVDAAPSVAGRVVDLGLVDDDQRPHVYAAAAAYVQPSRNESFSRTIMESWLAGTPVIASSGSDVVAWHCARSGGGLTYDDPDELVQALLLVASQPDALSALGPAGREYVTREYAWPSVIDRMDAALSELPSRLDTAGPEYRPSGVQTVVAAPYPTMPGPEAAATFAMVRSFVDAGDEVTVVSPSPSAAHQHADPGGPRGAARLARLAAGADRLVVRLDAGALGAGADSPRLLPGRLGLSAALRRAKRAEVRLDRVPSIVSARFAKLVLGPAALVLVSTEQERAALVAAGVAESVITVDPEPDPGFWRDERSVSDRLSLQNPGVDELRELIRTRAAEERAATQRVAAATEGEAGRPLRHLVRMERPPARSHKPGGAMVKRLLARVLAWQFDYVAGHVNQLHQATIEAIDKVEAQRRKDKTSS